MMHHRKVRKTPEGDAVVQVEEHSSDPEIIDELEHENSEGPNTVV